MRYTRVPRYWLPRAVGRRLVQYYNVYEKRADEFPSNFFQFRSVIVRISSLVGGVEFVPIQFNTVLHPLDHFF